MQINEAYICFVNSHLAAHTNEVDRRKEDYDGIRHRMMFDYDTSIHFGLARRSIDEHK